MEFVEHFGILASIAWNSTGWTGPLTAADLKKSAYDYVKENQDAAENLNFGHERYPAEADGTYIGYTPMLNQKPKEQHLAAVFLLSSDYQHQNRKCIVGVYAFPQIGDFTRKAKHKVFKKYDGGNVRSRVEDIIYFSTPVVIDKTNVVSQNLLPVDKAISQRGFNYLTSENVVNILRLAARANRRDAKLKALLSRFEFDDELVGPEEPEGLSGLPLNSDAGTLAGIEQLETKMQKLRPQVKHRVSTFIERGTIAAAVKRHTGYKCLLCEAMGLNPIGFIKTNGVPYVETHHVDPVANRATGALGLANIITLCANHHRQMHYGNVQLVKLTKTQFRFQVDGADFVIKKIKV
ncbi:hypothetical protein [Hymenobacter sp. GOD-10R]|jgi:hypothetical protein|uniref:HNH endonuclease n=1 Tax=Hymenobacter sp. GOD-10R TaxID=3093922 RepID=UPI002D78647B|nr:hypothetical protein [Hymenobacter sp. GOD-10R]WRQ31474.1 hypothetical protein SD425_26730 [Hymenobacter sp. GOD-10R]